MPPLPGPVTQVLAGGAATQAHGRGPRDVACPAPREVSARSSSLRPPALPVQAFTCGGGRLTAAPLPPGPRLARDAQTLPPFTTPVS